MGISAYRIAKETKIPATRISEIIKEIDALVQIMLFALENLLAIRQKLNNSIV